MQNLKKILKNKKGFTLVELMVVVAILGILVAVAVPVYGNVTQNAKTQTCKANVQTIKSAVTTALANGADKTKLACEDVKNPGADSVLGDYLDTTDLSCPFKSTNKYKVVINSNNDVDVTCEGGHN